MKICRSLLIITLIFLEFGCSSTKKNILQTALASDNPKIKTVMSNPEAFELQIIYTQILRDKNNKVSFKDFTYHLNANNYYYPASTVKFPMAILALEKLNTIKNTSKDTQYMIEGNPDKLRFSEEITKVFAVSSNEASTNLLEFIGFDYLNDSMKSKGLTPFRVSNRVSAPDAGNPITKPITLYKDDNSIMNLPAIQNKPSVPLQLHHLKKGIGYMKDDKLVNEPFDFSNKNYYPLETLQNTMKRIIFPEAFSKSERFNLTAKDREFILFSMQNVPKNAGYDPAIYYDGYCKFFMFGDTKDNIPANIKIYNKPGDAYGTIIDCAYIVDTENKVEFIVSATLLVNKDQIFNDDIYELNAVGLPFLGELGRQLYAKNVKK
ncbi:MAG: serine hydrolase [Flavobacterium sp.]|uniref:serine hydrolase n=1 Tax=Flavobacterium sp. TaxID=239 RepID=UPI00261BEE1C|nr:serine hydrolase [Flavobacterium sp.]MDD5149089.1 serine hydrolase [Flavobacterium sp.]